MTLDSRPRRPLPVPESIALPLRRVGLRRRRIAAARAAIRLALIVLLLVLPVALVLGSVRNPGTVSTLIVAGVTWFIIAAATILLLVPLLKRPVLSGIARDVERQMPQLHERLSSAIDLPIEDDSPFAASVALKRQLLQEAAAEAARLDPRRLMPARPLRPWLVVLAVGLSFCATLAALPMTRRAVAAGTYRLAFPWRESLPDALAEIAVVPGDATLDEDDSIDIIARAPAAALLVRHVENGPRQTLEMARADGAWRATLADVRESFRYQVTTGAGGSRWFTVAVRPRPALASLTLRYDYPAYTRLPARTVIGLDANIDAVVGTHVTLTARTSQPLDLNASFVTADGRVALQQPPDDDAYHATLTVAHDGTYAFHLTNTSGLPSRTAQPGKIIAHPDQVPSVVIQSPDPEVSVRPDDVVPLRFLAGDDFGISRLELLVESAGTPTSRAIPVSFDTADPRHVTGPDLQLAVRDLLPSGGAGAIRYRLRVTDNRDPDPQTALSVQRTLRVDPEQSVSYQGTIDQKLARGLDDVLKNTIRELERARPRLTQSKTRDGSEPLGEWQRKELRQAAIDLPDSRERLARAAEQAADSPLRPVARALSSVADGPLRAAAEQAARANLDPDEWRERNDAIVKAAAAIDEARALIQKLLDAGAVERTRGAAEAARDLAAAHDAQREAAERMRDGQPQPAAAARRRAAERLRQAIAQHPPLADESAARLARQLQDLIRKLATARAQPAVATSRAVELARDAEVLARTARQASDDDLEGRAKRAGEAITKANDPNKLNDALADAEKQLRGLSRQLEPGSQRATAQAARDAQEAAEAQLDASAPNPAAAAASASAAQAASALQRAAAAMSAALSQSATDAAASPVAAAPPGTPATGANGARGTAAATAGPPPAAIRDLGISLEHWARLPPLARRDLLAAAQQSGPPAYRQMIRDYYLKLAQMHEGVADPQQ